MTIRTSIPGIGAVPNAGDLYLYGLSIEGADTIAGLAASGARLRGERVVVKGVRGGTALEAVGLLSEGGRIELDGVILDGADHGILSQPNSAGAMGSVRLADAHVTGQRVTGALVQEGGSLQLSRAAFTENMGTGVRVNGGTLDARDVAVSGTTYLHDLLPGNGLVITRGSATVEGASFERNTRAAIYLADIESVLVLRDAIVRDTAAQLVEEEPGYDSSDGGGYGLWITESTRAVVERARFERNRAAGMIAVDPLAFLSATDVVVRDTEPGLERSTGLGLALRRTATASITRALFERNRGTGIDVIGRSTIELGDVTVRDSAIGPIGEDAVGMLVVGDDTRASVSRARFERNELYGIAVQGRGLVQLDDVAVAGTRPLPDGRLGAGLGVARRARLSGSRISIEDSRSAGMVAYDGVELAFSDLVVRGTQRGLSPDRFPVGRGISLEIGVTATITRALIADNLEIGLVVDDASSLVLRDAAIVRTGALDGFAGRGLQVQSESLANIENVCLEANHEVGILVSSGDIVGRDITVLGTEHNQCFDDGTCDIPGGFGMYAASLGRISISGFLLSGNVETGLTIAGGENALGISGGEMDLIDGVVSYNGLGADVRNEDFDTSRITLRVQYVNNQIDGVESGTTKLPDTNTAGLY
jgi:hypothetical protein